MVGLGLTVIPIILTAVMGDLSITRIVAVVERSEAVDRLARLAHSALNSLLC